MTVVWKRGKTTAAAVQAALAAKRSLKDSTVRTILTRLEEKGYAKHKLDGRSFVYSGVEKPQEVAVRAVKQILDRFCHGSVESLLCGMVEDEVVDPEELRAIAKRLADGNAGKTAKKQGKRKK